MESLVVELNIKEYNMWNSFDWKYAKKKVKKTIFINVFNR